MIKETLSDPLNFKYQDIEVTINFNSLPSSTATIRGKKNWPQELSVELDFFVLDRAYFKEVFLDKTKREEHIDEIKIEKNKGNNLVARIYSKHLKSNQQSTLRGLNNKFFNPNQLSFWSHTFRNEYDREESKKFLLSIINQQDGKLKYATINAILILEEIGYSPYGEDLQTTKIKRSLSGTLFNKDNLNGTDLRDTQLERVSLRRYYRESGLEKDRSNHSSLSILSQQAPNFSDSDEEVAKSNLNIVPKRGSLRGSDSSIYRGSEEDKPPPSSHSSSSTSDQQTPSLSDNEEAKTNLNGVDLRDPQLKRESLRGSEDKTPPSSPSSSTSDQQTSSDKQETDDEYENVRFFNDKLEVSMKNGAVKYYSLSTGVLLRHDRSAALVTSSPEGFKSKLTSPIPSFLPNHSSAVIFSNNNEYSIILKRYASSLDTHHLFKSVKSFIRSQYKKLKKLQTLEIWSNDSKKCILKRETKISYKETPHLFPIPTTNIDLFFFGLLAKNGLSIWQINLLGTPKLERIHRLLLSIQSQIVSARFYNGRNIVFLLSSGSKITKIDLPEKTSQEFNHSTQIIVFDTCDQASLIAFLDEEKNLFLLKADHLEVLYKAKLNFDCNSLQFSPDGKFITAYSDSHIFLWNLSEKKMELILPQEEDTQGMNGKREED